jgi:hypothetical protein
MPDRGEMGMRAQNALAMRVPTNHATENEGLMRDPLTEWRYGFVSYGGLILIFVGVAAGCADDLATDARRLLRSMSSAAMADPRYPRLSFEKLYTCSLVTYRYLTFSR